MVEDLRHVLNLKSQPNPFCISQEYAEDYTIPSSGVPWNYAVNSYVVAHVLQLQTFKHQAFVNL